MTRGRGGQALRDVGIGLGFAIIGLTASGLGLAIIVTVMALMMCALFSPVLVGIWIIWG